MKKIINIVLIIVVTAMFSCTTTKKAVVQQPAPKVESLSDKYDRKMSVLLDSVVVKVILVEDNTFNSDTASVDKHIQSAVKEFQDSVKILIDSFSIDWDKYVRDSTSNYTKDFKKIQVTGKYVTVHRVLEIIATPVTRNGKQKIFNNVIKDAIDLGKKQMYFSRGDNMKYHFQDALFNELSYFDKEFMTIDEKSLDAVVQRFMAKRPNEFKEAKVIEKMTNRSVYGATVAKAYWKEWSSTQIANYLYAATQDNVALRHSKQ